MKHRLEDGVPKLYQTKIKNPIQKITEAQVVEHL
jgi:hypothetical protein